jgi:predicted XRE-type DNA-binding protein
MKKDPNANRKSSVITGSGNVFKDLGLPHNEEDMFKVAILGAITDTIKKRNLTQADAAKIIKADQAKVSALLRGRLDGYTVDRLVRYLLLLGRDVDVHISQRYKENKPGKLRVRAA